MSKRKRLSELRRGSIRNMPRLGTILAICWTTRGRADAAIECLRKALRVAPDYADAMFNLALLLQRKNQYTEAAEY
jgi:tetratricopeptide (TPR) repeat protein